MKSGSALVLLLLLSSTVVFGQLEKGNIFIQGSSSIGFNTQKDTYTHAGTSTEASKSTNFNFSPKAGYFIIDNLPVGLAINFDTYKSKATNSDNEYSSLDFTIGPFARFYFAPQDKLKPMAEAYVGFGSSKSKSKSSSYTSETKYGVFKFGVGAGASYFVTDHVAFDLLIGYSSITDKLKSETSPAKSTTAEDTSYKYTGIGINIGVVVTIPN